MSLLIPDSRALLGYLVLSLVLGVCHRRFASPASFLTILYCLPFTIMHEASHLVAAFITGGRPSSWSILPRRKGRGWVLGSVTSVPTLLSACPTALAPLVWLLIGYGAMVFWEQRPHWMPDYLLPVLLYCCAASCVPSRQDLRILFKYPLSLLLWAGMGVLLLLLITFSGGVFHAVYHRAV